MVPPEANRAESAGAAIAARAQTDAEARTAVVGPARGLSVALVDDEKPRLVADLGNKNYFMLRNHGLLTVAPTIADAFQMMYTFENACTIQIRAQAGGGELIPISQAIIDGAVEQSRQVTKGLGGRLAWPGLLRRLDRRFPGYDQ